MELNSNNYQDFFEENPSALCLVNSQGVIIDANSSCIFLFKYLREEMVNSKLKWFVDPVFWDSWVTWIASGALGSLETVIVSKSNSKLYALVKSSELRIKDESFFLINFTDLTHYQRAQDSLRKEKESALRSTQVKSEFLANMSHEIRTPLHTINGLTGLLAETVLNAEQREYVNQVQFAGRVLLDLINDILDFSKIEAGKLDLENIPFDLYELLEQSVDMVALEAFKKGLDVGLYLEKTVPHMLIGDPLRIRQIIINLFNNAVKFTHHGQIIVSVTQVKISNIPFIKISVKDSGIGIPSSTQKRLFKAFHQVDSSTTRKYGGTGLGLAICKDLIELMGGSIHVNSKEAEGSDFYVHFPVHAQKEANIYDYLPDLFFDNLPVLLVDDNQTIRSILRKYLEEWGCKVIEAGSGEEVLELLYKQKENNSLVKVILIDNQMPVMDGWRLANEINSNESLRSIKKIMMSWAGVSEENAKMRLLGWFDGYLVKPIKRQNLLEVMFKVSSGTGDIEPLEPVEEETLGESQGVSLKCLVAEDHEVNQKLFQKILQRLGHQVILASNGKIAFEEAMQNNPDVVFMDMQMPEMNGIDAARALINSGFKNPIIAVTANALPAEKKACLDAGMVGFITKPFQKEDIENALSSFVEISSSAEELISIKEDVEDDEVFNLSSALDTFLGDGELLASLVVRFVKKLFGQIEKIEEAIKAKDYGVLDYEGHSLKGSARNLAMFHLGEISEVIEKKGKEMNAQGLEQDLSILKAAAEELRLRIEAVFSSK